MNVLVKINPATYGIDTIRQVMLGASADSPFGISLFGHTMTVWDDVIVLAAFLAVMLSLAVWSFGNQD